MSKIRKINHRESVYYILIMHSCIRMRHLRRSYLGISPMKTVAFYTSKALLKTFSTCQTNRKLICLEKCLSYYILRT